MQDRKSNEIDLLTLFYSLAYNIKKHLIMMLIIVVSCCVLFFGYSFVPRQKYQSKMILTSGILSFSYAKELTADLNLLLREREFKRVAQKLNIPEQVVENITSIEVEPVYEEKSVPLKENEKTNLILKATALNTETFDYLEKGFVYYLENNNYVKVRVDQQKKYYQEVEARIEKEIADLENFKDQIAKGAFFQKVQGNVMFDPTIVNTKIIELTKEKIRAAHSLELSNNIQVIESFTAYSQALWPRKSTAILLGVVVGMFISLSILAFKAITYGIKMYEATKGAGS